MAKMKEWSNELGGEFLRDRFIKHAARGAKPNEAIYYAIVDVGLKVFNESKGNPELINEKFYQMRGVIPSPLLDFLRYELQKLSDSNDSTKGKKLSADPLIFGFVVTSSGSIEDIPQPACMENHLPQDRKPTEEELKKAWELCKK